MATIASLYFHECVQGARRKGIDVAILLERAGVDPRLLADPTARGDVRAMARLIQEVWASMNDEFMGFTEHPVKVGTFGLMTRFVLPCASIEGVLEAGARFYNLTSIDAHQALTVAGDEARFTVAFARPDLDPEHYFLELWMIIWLRLVGWLMGCPLPLRWASFTFSRPTSAEELKYMFPCEQRFDAASSGFAFDRELLRSPVVRTRDELKAQLVDAPLLFMTAPPSELELARRIRASVAPRPGQPVDFPRVEDIADRFHMTTQTLRRALKKEGSSYGVIKEQIRRDIAIEKVVKSNVRIEDVALAVGYSETRAFTRAFHNWTGLSPLRYRERFHSSRVR